MMNNVEHLANLLSQYFSIGDSYAYNLTRVKSAFDVGTMSLDDFEEFDKSTIEDIAHFLARNCVIVPPVEVGSVVYGIHEVWKDEGEDDTEEDIYANEVLRGEVRSYSLNENKKLWAFVQYDCGLTYWHKSEDFGVSVFSTFEEADIALKSNFSEE